MLLHHHIMSAPSRHVRLVLGEYECLFDMVEELPWARRPEFLQLNPAGTLPVLIADAEEPVSGWYPISEYLDETRGIMMRDRRLMPDYPLDRAEARRLTDWFLIKLNHDVVQPLVRERIFKPQMPADAGGGAPDSRLMRSARANIRQHMRYVDWLAANRNWLGGPALSVADMAAGASLSILDYMGEIEWGEHGHAQEWYRRLKSRPAFRPLLGDKVRGMPAASHYADPDF